MITLSNKTFYITLALFSTLVVGIFVTAQSGTPNPGHDDNSIYIQSLGKTLDQAISAGDMARPDCTITRTGPYGSTDGTAKSDAVSWCPSDKPRLVQCNALDDQAPTTGPTKISTQTQIAGGCQTNGLCDATQARPDAGADDVYTETIVKDDGMTQGCWAYDYEGLHYPYKIETICCK